MSLSTDIPVRVTEIEPVTERIKRFRFERIDGQPMPGFSAGSHCVVIMRNGRQVRRNPYSLMGSPFDTTSYQISVLRTEDSRGGSAFMHEQVHVGSELEISQPLNLFPIERTGKKHLMISGGIGITPLVSMMESLHKEDQLFELHYGMRSAAHGAFWKDLKSRFGHRVNTYFDDQKQTIPLHSLLENQPLGTHIYVCGPSPMIDWVLKSAREAGWPDENVHSERFMTPPTGKPFTVELTKSKKTIEVGEFQSVLEAVEAAGVEAPFLCRGGACGQCETQVHSCDGTLEHNDHYLTDEEKGSGKKFMICVSRIKGQKLVLDL